jgi:hypothetical protein
LERRQKFATEAEQEKFGAVCKIEYMSEDDDDPNGEGWCHLRLNWRAERVSEFFQTLDSRARAIRKEFMKGRTKRTFSGE